MISNQTTKQWLYSVRAIERRKRAIVHEIANLKAEHETLFDAATTFYGEIQVQSNHKSEPTLRRALTLCDRMTKKLDDLLRKIEHLTLEAEEVRMKLNEYFSCGDITVQEFEAIFYYFFEGMNDEEVAEIMHYSVKYTSEIKNEGIKKIQKLRSSG